MILCQCLCRDLLEIGSLAKGSRMCGQLGQVPDGQGTSMEAEWATSHCQYYANCSWLFYLTTGPHAWIQFLFTLPTFIFFVSLTPLPPRFWSIFFPFSFLSSNFMAFSTHVASQHVARLGPNILTFSFLIPVHKSSFHQVMPSNARPSSGFEFSFRSSPPAIPASHFVN